jgi:hypothetical protein
MNATNDHSVPTETNKPRVQLGVVSWIPVANMAYPEWVAAGRRIGAMGRASNWWVGDWIRYGTERWGEKYLAAARMTGYDVHSLRNMAYVASRFELSLRRDNLTWSHHALLAALGKDEQCHWLDRATDERLSVADLRTELRASQRGNRRSVGARRESSQPPAVDSGNVCPKCGHEIPAGTSDWNVFVGGIMRRRYGLGSPSRRPA